MVNTRKLNFFEKHKLRKTYNLLLKVSSDDIETAKIFINSFYGTIELPDNFYMIFIYGVQSKDYEQIFNILQTRNIYDLIRFLKCDEPLENIEELINPYDYFNLSSKQIIYIADQIKQLGINNEIKLKKSISNNPHWMLRRPSIQNGKEYTKIAIKMYTTIGFDNSIDLLKGKYGVVDYEIIHYLFNNLNTEDKNYNEIFNEFLFDNNVRLMLEGELQELFINFDYFYNSLEHFIEKLGNKLDIDKVQLLLKERYLAPKVEHPEISGDVLADMLSSYYHKYGILEEDKWVLDENMRLYEQLKTKTKSSIMSIEPLKIGDYTIEMVPLSDVRNLVMGYRASNCFRINGASFVLFNNFVTDPNMRLLSISTEREKDFGMVLLMRNGNVLIGQGITTNKHTSDSILGEKLYSAVRMAMKNIMDSMNKEDDEIVATIIGLTNSNTTPYNNDILPFLINPAVEIPSFTYNGICNYQGLLDIKEGKKLSDIELFIPTKFYPEKKEQVYNRYYDMPHDSAEYREIEKILISLRFARFRTGNKDEINNFYFNLSSKREVYTVCTSNWFITVYQDGTIDSFINSNNPIVVGKYNTELEKAKMSPKRIKFHL